MDSDTDAILDQIPEKQKSAFVREAVKLKARTLEDGAAAPKKRTKVVIDV